LNAFKVFAQLIATTSTAVFGALWLVYSPTDILHKHPQAFFVALGFLFASLVGRIVFARMCKAEFSWFQPLAIPVILGFINAYTKQGCSLKLLMFMFCWQSTLPLIFTLRCH
jgi:hypothetical protein